MRFIVTGGGTGGHIYPALAVARGLQQKYPAAEILYIGTASGLEAEIVPRAGFSFHPLRLSGLRRKLSLQNIAVLLRAGAGTIEARRVIKKFKPAAVIGTGGYVCGPVAAAAASCRIPVLIHEQNALPGITNRLLSLMAARVAVTFEDSVQRFPGRVKKKIQVTGLPVRPEVISAVREQARAKFGLQPGEILILSFGGSQGAKSINRAMARVLKEFSREEGIKFLHVTGQAQYEEFQRYCRREGLQEWGASVAGVVPYLHDMPDALAAADLAVCRAGAATLAELTVRGLPAILIPYPYAAENHQEYNARALASRGAAVMIADHELNGGRLADIIRSLVQDRDKLKNMAEACRTLGKPGALQDILDLIDKLEPNK